MGKTKTSKKRIESFTYIARKNKQKIVRSTPSRKEKELRLKKNTGLIPYDPLDELLDENFISKAIWDCLKNNDPQGVLEVIAIHLSAINKSRAASKMALPRSSLYNAFKTKNPTLKTLAKLVNCFV